MAGSSTRSPPRNTPATTSKCSTSICRSPRICSSDMILRPALVPADIVREQSVILEEIKMVEDAPDDLVHEVFAQQFWPRHPLGRPILGTPETVSSFEQEGLRRYFGRMYVAPQLLIAVAGHIDHAAVRDLVERTFASVPTTADGTGTTPPRCVSRRGVSAEGHRTESFVHGHARVSSGARGSARALRAEHDPWWLDEFPAVSAHSRGPRPGVFRVQHAHDLQRRRHADHLCRLRGRQGVAGRGSLAGGAAPAARRRPCRPTNCAAPKITSRAA